MVKTLPSKHTMLFIVLSCISLSCLAARKTKIYAIYTPSHEGMFKQWFLPSIKDDYEVVTEFFDPHGGTGSYMKKDWCRAVEKKVELIIKAIKNNWGAIFVFSDVDITFYGQTWAHIKKAMGADKDMVFQKEAPKGTLCTGFFACRANKKTLSFWRAVKKAMREHKNKWHDQHAANYLLRESGARKRHIKWGYLPSFFFGGGTLTGKRWNPGMDLPVPEDIVMHHANWTVGIENKIHQLNYVNGVVEQRAQ